MLIEEEKMTNKKKEQPLLGDRVDHALKKMGAGRAAKLVEKVTKRPCGCQKRRRMLNNLHRRMRGNRI